MPIGCEKHITQTRTIHSLSSNQVHKACQKLTYAHEDEGPYDHEDCLDEVCPHHSGESSGDGEHGSHSQ